MRIFNIAQIYIFCPSSIYEEQKLGGECTVELFQLSKIIANIKVLYKTTLYIIMSMHYFEVNPEML